MPERAVQVVNEAGIHARPAAEIVKTAQAHLANSADTPSDNMFLSPSAGVFPPV